MDQPNTDAQYENVANSGDSLADSLVALGLVFVFVAASLFWISGH